MTLAGSYFLTLPEQRVGRHEDSPKRGEAFEPYWPGRSDAEREVKETEAQRQASYRQAVDDAYARGLRDGERAKSIEMDDLLAQTMANCETAVAAAEVAFVETHARQYSTQLAAGLAAIGSELDAAVAAVLQPLILDRLKRELVDDAIRALARVTDAATATTVRVHGPDRFVKVLTDDLQKIGIAVSSHVDEGAELAIAIDGTLIRSRMQDWLRKLEEALQ